MTIALRVSSLVVACALACAPSSACAAAPASARPPAPPDSVLATIGRGATSGERVTARELRAAAAKLGANPDSLDATQVRDALDALVDQKLLLAAVAREPRRWSAEDSAEYAALESQLELATALDSAYANERAARAARGEPALDPVTLGYALRDSAMRRLHPVYDGAVFAHVATAFAALPRPEPTDDILTRGRKLAQAPALAPADSDRVIATLQGRPFTVRELMREWKAMRILKRPHISSAAEMTDFVNTWLYQRLLRERAHAGHVLAQPQNAVRLRERAEYLDVRSWTVRHVYARVPRDSATLRRAYDADPARTTAPARAEIARAVLATRSAADSVAAAWRTTAASARTEPIDTRIDSTLTARCVAAGPGALLGPERVVDGWQVVRVVSAQPARRLAFAEARPRLERDALDREGEPLLRATLDAMRRERGVIVNERALARAATKR